MDHVWKTKSTVRVAARANVGNEYLSCCAKPHRHAGPLQACGWSLDGCLRLPSNGPVRVERSYPKHHRFRKGLIGPIVTGIKHVGSVGYDRRGVRTYNTEIVRGPGRTVRTCHVVETIRRNGSTAGPVEVEDPVSSFGVEAVAVPWIDERLCHVVEECNMVTRLEALKGYQIPPFTQTNRAVDSCAHCTRPRSCRPE